jgi:UDP-glucose:(heptosyl)LPS alpha-1,3-glucosyltransferase
MKLGFLLFDYFPFGGLQRDCLKTASLCAARGHDVTIFTRTWQGDRPDHVQVELFGRKGHSNLARNRTWLKQLAATLPARGLDGVIGFNKLPGLDVYFGSDPCYVAKAKRLKGFWYRWLPRYRHFRALEEAVFARGQRTQILVLTEAEVPRYREIYGTERERFHLLPPGIARRTYEPYDRAEARHRVRREFGWEYDDHILLLVGSGFRVKGLDRAIRALAALPEDSRAKTRLVVIGQNRPTEFEMQARQLGVREHVYFLGGRDDVFDWLLAADLLVHPARSEAAGMILLEALTAGLPVLATDVCGYAPHIERAGAGRILRSPFSQAACNAAVSEMLTSGERDAWSQSGVAYAAREDLYSCHERAVTLIEKMAGAMRSSPRPGA